MTNNEKNGNESVNPETAAMGEGSSAASAGSTAATGTDLLNLPASVFRLTAKAVADWHQSSAETGRVVVVAQADDLFQLAPSTEAVDLTDQRVSLSPEHLRLVMEDVGQRVISLLSVHGGEQGGGPP